MQDPSILARRPVKLAVVAAFALAIAAAALVWSQQGGAAGAGDQTRPGVALPSPQAGGTQVSGSVSKWDGIDATDNPCTTSTSYVDMPGMSVTFTTTTLHQRYVIEFQGEWFNHDRALVRALVDGNVVTGPGDDASPLAVDSGNDAGAEIDETNGFNFISDDVASSI